MPPQIPQGHVWSITEAQGKGMRLERYTARFAVLLAAAAIPTTPLFNIQDAENAVPAATVQYQSTKTAFRQGAIVDFNYINVRRIAVLPDLAVNHPVADLNLLSMCKIQIARQSEPDVLSLSVAQAWGRTEGFQATLAATNAMFFSQGAGYDVSDGGHYKEDVKVNSPTIGDSTAAFVAPGIWLPVGPFQISLVPQRQAVLTALSAAMTVEFQLRGYRLVTNVS